MRHTVTRTGGPVGLWLVLSAVLALLLAACGGTDGADGGADAGAAPTTEAADPADATEMATGDDGEAAGGTTVAVAESDLGRILVDGEGMTLYLFDNDSEGQSACTGGCAETWPPLTGEASAGEGVDSGLLGTITREDGSTQVTYNGHPLYYYAPDSQPGDVTGQGVGDVWWVVNPAGEAVRDGAAASPTGGGAAGY